MSSLGVAEGVVMKASGSGQRFVLLGKDFTSYPKVFAILTSEEKNEKGEKKGKIAESVFNRFVANCGGGNYKEVAAILEGILNQRASGKNIITRRNPLNITLPMRIILGCLAFNNVEEVKILRKIFFPGLKKCAYNSEGLVLEW